MVGALERAFPGWDAAVSWRYALSPLVDACSTSVARIDEAYYLLEEMHKEVCILHSARDCVPSSYPWAGGNPINGSRTHAGGNVV
jgi:hypothetical protein